MSTLQRLRDAFDRMEHVFSKRPAMALATNVARARLVDGVHCEAAEEGWRFVMDLPVDSGGTNAGPPPGVHGRVALAGCLAMGYSVQLARAGIEPRSIEVEVEADSDHRGMLGLSERPGYLALRHTLYLDCDASREQVQPAIDRAQRLSPYLSMFMAGQPVSGKIVFAPRVLP
nr:OsmC family protein [uncultured Roseateles sp.]